MDKARTVWTYAVLGAMVVGGLGGTAEAGLTSVTLTDHNSVAEFDLLSSAGLKSWTVDGTEHINQQWFWYRVGSGAERPISDLTLEYHRLSDSNGDGDDDTLYARYAGDGVRIELTFLLTGGVNRSHISDMAETIRITNTGAAAIDLSFFQYVDFDLGGDGSQDTVTIQNGNTVLQTAANVYVAETVVTPMPDHHQAGLAAALLASLEDGGPTTLTDDPGPKTGNVSWSFQWDKTVGAGRSVIISKDKNIIPEPATVALMGSGLVMALVLRRKR